MSAEIGTATKRSSKYLKIAIAAAIYLGISLTLASIPADTLIDAIGSNNAFLLMLALGTLGGLTTFTGIPYHLILMSLAAGGIDPIGLGFFTALGVMAGDSTMYFIGSKVKGSLPPRLLATVNQLSIYLQNHPRQITPMLIGYGAFSPFSNDFIVGSLSMTDYSYWRTIIPLAIGNIFFNIALAYLGVYAYDLIIDWL